MGMEEPQKQNARVEDVERAHAMANAGKFSTERAKQMRNPNYSLRQMYTDPEAAAAHMESYADRKERLASVIYDLELAIKGGGNVDMMTTEQIDMIKAVVDSAMASRKPLN